MAWRQGQQDKFDRATKRTSQIGNSSDGGRIEGVALAKGSKLVLLAEINKRVTKVYSLQGLLNCQRAAGEIKMRSEIFGAKKLLCGPLHTAWSATP